MANWANNHRNNNRNPKCRSDGASSKLPVRGFAGGYPWGLELSFGMAAALGTGIVKYGKNRAKGV